MENYKLFHQLPKKYLFAYLETSGFSVREIRKKNMADLHDLLQEWLLSSGFSTAHHFPIPSEGLPAAQPQEGCDCCKENLEIVIDSSSIASSSKSNAFSSWCASHDLPPDIAAALMNAGLDSPSQVAPFSSHSAAQLKDLFLLKSLPLAILLHHALQSGVKELPSAAS